MDVVDLWELTNCWLAVCTSQKRRILKALIDQSLQKPLPPRIFSETRDFYYDKDVAMPCKNATFFTLLFEDVPIVLKQCHKPSTTNYQLEPTPADAALLLSVLIEATKKRDLIATKQETEDRIDTLLKHVDADGLCFRLLTNIAKPVNLARNTPLFALASALIENHNKRAVRINMLTFLVDISTKAGTIKFDQEGEMAFWGMPLFRYSIINCLLPPLFFICKTYTFDNDTIVPCLRFIKIMCCNNNVYDEIANGFSHMLVQIICQLSPEALACLMLLFIGITTSNKRCEMLQSQGIFDQFLMLFHKNVPIPTGILIVLSNMLDAHCVLPPDLLREICTLTGDIATFDMLFLLLDAELRQEPFRSIIASSKIVQFAFDSFQKSIEDPETSITDDVCVLFVNMLFSMLEMEASSSNGCTPIFTNAVRSDKGVAALRALAKKAAHEELEALFGKYLHVPLVLYEEGVTCGLCMDNMADTVCVPCGHADFCAHCLLTFYMKKKSFECTICRRAVLSTKKRITK